MSNEVKLYGVSYGNGNDGVSQSFPSFYCRTDKPYALARLAMITAMYDNTQAWAADVVEIDGEAEYSISATIYNPPTDPREEVKEEEEEEDSWCNANGAWMIAEVFPVEEDDKNDKPTYDSLEECFGADVVAKFGDDQ